MGGGNAAVFKKSLEIARENADNQKEMSDKPYTIHSERKIREVDIEAIESLGMIKVVTKGHGSFMSRIMKIHDGNLLIEQPVPTTKECTVVGPGTQVQIHYYPLGTGLYIFNTTYMGKAGVGSHCQLEFPETIKFVQRRDAYRVEPMHSFPAEVVSIIGKRVAEKTRIENISITGICLSFLKPAELRTGMKMPQILLYLNNDQMLELGGIIRGTWSGAGGRLFVGISWRGMSPNNRKLLNAYILNCQRLELRRDH